VVHLAVVCKQVPISRSLIVSGGGEFVAEGNLAKARGRGVNISTEKRACVYEYRVTSRVVG
jgi:hypothetical protein